MLSLVFSLHHRFRKYKNQLLDLQISQPEQVWVSDITYIGKREKPCYLSLITDAYSKKIVGYNVSDNLNTESSMVALRLAVKHRKNKRPHLSNHMLTPNQMHEQNKIVMKTYKTKNSIKNVFDAV